MSTTPDTVMLASADTQIQRVLRAFCDEHGSSLTVVTSAKGGFTALAQSSPSMVLVDFDLPDNGALAIRRMAAKRTNQSPVILLSPPSLGEEWVLVFECDAYMTKPFTRTDLAGKADLLGWSPGTAQDVRYVQSVPPTSEHASDDGNDEGQTVFDRVSSRPRLQPYRLRPSREHSDVVSDTEPAPEVFQRVATAEIPAPLSSVDEEHGAWRNGGPGADTGGSPIFDTGPIPMIDTGPNPVVDTGPIPEDVAVQTTHDQIALLWPRLSHEDPHYLLDVPRNAALKEVRKKFRRLRRDIQGGVDLLDRRERHRADHLMGRLKKAYDTIVAALVQRGAPEKAEPAHDFGRQEQTGEQRLEALRRLARRQIDIEKAKKDTGKKREIDPGPGKRGPAGYARAFFKEARQLAAIQKWKEAFELTQEALEKTPHDPELIAFDAWALLHVPTTEPDATLDTCGSRLSIALTLREDYGEAHYYLGRVRERQGSTEDAVSCYRRALELDPRLSRYKLTERIRKLEGRM